MADMDAATQSMIRNMAEKTGKSLEQWVEVAKASGEEKHGQIIKHLKGEHGLTHGYANLVALTARGKFPPPAGSSGEADLVDVQYAGPKATLRPFYEQILETVQGFGADVEIAPKKAYVSLRRSKQFGILQPSTRTRLDVGLVLKGTEPEGRLEKAGSFNTMMSHRMRVQAVEDIDDELLGWLRRAYEGA